MKFDIGRQFVASIACCLTLVFFTANYVVADDPEQAEYPPIEKVTEGFEVVAATNDDGAADGTSFYKLWINRKSNQVLAELPKDFAAPNQRHFIATTLSGGDVFAGLQSSDFYVYWKQYGKRMALVAEDLSIRGSDDESKASVKRLFTDTILVDVPIVAWVPRGGPVIDFDELLVNNATIFFGGSVRAAKPHLSSVQRIKAFPKNIEIAFELANADGNLKVLHYSISKIEGSPGFKPRVADQRIGYFTTAYDDYGKYEDDETRVRYINRWHLEKRDPSLQKSPPKQPIVFYLEHTTPVRYRRWVREGVLYWNQAFEQVGIVNAIEVRQQDKQTGEHMNRDPEDVRYNFIRWLNNNISTAIGPSRVNPTTGEILDADIVLTDGWIRTFENEFENVMPKIAMQGMSAETLDWFASHPDWDPRVRMAAPSQREFVRESLMLQARNRHLLGTPFSTQDRLLNDEMAGSWAAKLNKSNGACFAADGRKFDVAFMRMAVGMMMAQDDKDEEKGEKKDDKAEVPGEQMLDGMPESFIGPLLADLVCHEVGHTLGLRHNFKASSIYTLEEMNSEELKGKKPFAGSVMDYLPVNFNFESGKIQGDYAMIGVGPYDLWAIEYGYTLDEAKLPTILKRVAEPELVFATDEDTVGSDPLARRYDFSKDPLDFAMSQTKLARHHREKILEAFVKDGDPWNKARRGYMMTLAMQLKSSGMMANWIGGAHINRDKKGDPNGRKPIEVVDAAKQRKALTFVIENTFFDEAYGLTPELLQHLVDDSWRDSDFNLSSMDPVWPVHDQVSGIQASTLSQLLNPTTLRRVYDNEFRVPTETDAVTLNELMTTVTAAVWKELNDLPTGNFSDRKPAISSLRRNLQAEHLNRLFDLAATNKGAAAMKPIANLAALTLVELSEKLAEAKQKENLDNYTRAHLVDLHDRIGKWSEAKYLMQNAQAPTIMLPAPVAAPQDR